MILKGKDQLLLGILKLCPGQYSPATLSESLHGSGVLWCDGIPSNEGGCDQLSGVLDGRYTLVNLLQPRGIYRWGKSAQSVSSRAQFPHEAFPDRTTSNILMQAVLHAIYFQIAATKKLTTAFLHISLWYVGS